MSFRIREGDQGVFIYRKKTKTLQKRINRLRINDFDSLLETSNAWQRKSVDGIAQVSKRALSLQSTRALNEILQDKFVERKCCALLGPKCMLILRY